MFNFDDVTLVDINIDFVLSKVSEYDIFKYYCQSFQAVNRVFRSDLRQDKNPSCCIQLYNGNYFYKDFSTGESFNCFTYLCKKYSCTFKEALNIIVTDFNLVKVKLKVNGQFITKNDIVPVLHEIVPYSPKETVIEPVFRSWKQTDFNYWSPYNISLALLTQYQVRPCRYVFIGNLRVDNRVSSPIYSYQFADRYKIYRPMEKEHKWYSNTNKAILQGFSQLPDRGEILILTKSLKDVLVYQSLGISAIAPQSETTDIDSVTIDLLKARFNKILVNYDQDTTGIQASHKLAQKYGFTELFIDGHKDLSDYMKNEGVLHTKQYITNKIYDKSDYQFPLS